MSPDEVVPFTVEEALAMRGTGWDGNLEEMRNSRPIAEFTDEEMERLDAFLRELDLDA
jgi:hypothetical protein